MRKIDPTAPSAAPARIVILGNGVAAWMSAAALARALAGSDRMIHLVEPNGFDHGIGPGGGATASLPGLAAFLHGLGLDEGLALGAQGCFSLGTAFSGWAGGGRDWFLPFGDLGAAAGPVPFHQVALRLRADGVAVRLGDHMMAALAASAGRFAHPLRNPRSPLSTYSYGFHLDLDTLQAQLKALASSVATSAAKFATVRRDPDGRVSGLALEDGSVVEGDLFVDCSGSRALLGEGSPFESWRRWLRCDRMLSGRAAADASPPPFTFHKALGHGWRQTVPLADAREQSLFFSSAHQPVEDDPGRSALPFEPGMRTPWSGNVVAIGSSAVMAEPLARTGLHLVQTAIERLLRLLPAGRGDVEAREYNRLALDEAERLRDFLILPYKANGRIGEPFWDECRQMEIPDSLAHKIALYQARGRVPLHDGETFERDDWVAMFDGLEVVPRRYDTLADGIPVDQLRQHVSRIHTLLARAAQSLPHHGDYLRQARQAMNRGR